jgi:hypothetical protein
MIDLDAARRFVWLNARLADRHRHAFLFDGGEAEAVVRAVAAYGNPDGGFGHALEPDLRSPTSQPGAVQQALEMLAEVGALHDPMVSRACAFLLAIQRSDGGIPFVLPTVGDDPRAPWWQPADASSLTQTAANAAALHREGVDHPWLEGATAYCWARVEQPIESAYDALFAVAFLDAVPDGERAAAALDALGPRLLDAGLVAVDPDAPGDAHSPLDLSPWPDARSRRLFAPELIDRHLDALAAGQQEDGGWTFAWPAWCAAAAHEWRGYVTVHALKVLRANGGLEHARPSRSGRDAELRTTPGRPADRGPEAD